MADPFESTRSMHQDWRNGSDKLLAALWREHPEIMKALGAKR